MSVAPKWVFIFALFLLPILAADQFAHSESKPKSNEPGTTSGAAAKSGDSYELPLNPTVYLLRDPAIHQELRLDSNAKQAILELAADANEPFWQLRNATPDKGPGAENLKLLRSQLNERLVKSISSSQRERLRQIALQLQGTAAFSQPEVLEQLTLSDTQQKKLTKLLEDYESELQELRVQAGSGKNLAELNRRARKMQSDLGKGVQGTLNATQKERWRNLLGKSFDASRLLPLAATAPELRDVSTWVNGRPLTLKELRGKVVVLHFYTFGCINCIHNFPSYKNYQQQFKNRDVTLVGIHTPETPGEKVAETVRKKAEENGFTFSIAVDNEMKNWQAWGNTMWPAVYLIDKRGFVRYWWYGELNWQGAGGEKYIASKIDELLAEK